MVYLNYNKVMGDTGIIIDPMGLLGRELADKRIKRQAITEVGLIALALGPIRTRKELLPVLVKEFA